MLREANLTRRTLTAALSVCLAAPAGVAIAQATLPPPPYAAQTASAAAQSETSARMRGGAPVYDRYGGGVVHAPLARTKTVYPASTFSAYTGPHLGWGGKSTQAAPLHPAAGPTPWRTAGTRTPYVQLAAAPRARLQYPSMAITAPSPAAGLSAPETYTPPIYASSPRQGAAPTSIYDPVPPTSAPVNAAAVSETPAMPGPPVRVASAAQGDGPRLYSLHRDYGMEPDPIPLAPQFFGPTADLTAPETPEVGHRTKTATGALVNAPTDAGGQP